MSKKLLIVDDHEIIRLGLHSMLEMTDLEIVGEAASAAEGEQGGKAAASAAAAAQAAVEDIFDRASAVRQQVLSGSLPYLADVLHDAYGCENESRPKTVDELVAVSTIPPPSSR